MTSPKPPMNPWLANFIVLGGFFATVAISYAVYWLWSGGREKMMSEPPPAPAVVAAPTPPARAEAPHWRAYREALARGETPDPLPLYDLDLASTDAAARAAALAGLEALGSAPALDRLERAAADPALRDLACAALARRGRQAAVCGASPRS